MGNIANPQGNKIAAAKLAVDGQVKHCQITDAFAELQMDTNGPDVFQLQWWLLPDQFAFILGFTGLRGFHFRLLVD